MSANQNQWQISKVINLGDIITMFLMLATLAGLYNSLDKRVEKNTQSIEFIKEQRIEDVKRVEKRLDSIDKKLDQILQGKTR